MLSVPLRRVLSSALVVGCAGCATNPSTRPPSVSSTPPTAVVPPEPADDLAAALHRDDPETAARLAQPRADAGDAEAQFVLGLLRDMGAGVRLDQPQARVWLEKSANQGYALARRYLAWKYEVGFAVEKADPAAAGLLRAQSADISLFTGFERWISFDGQNFVPNFPRAFLWMSQQASKGNPLAEANLAAVYMGGPWTQPDSSLHLSWLKRAADHGDAASLEQLALYSQVGVFLTKDPAQAFRYCEAAAQAGSASSQFSVGQAYEMGGDGVTANPAEAVRWYRLAAKQDKVEAIVRLENLLSSGATGMEPDYIESLQWARRGAELGNAEALADEAGMLREGKGAPQDYAAAAKLYEKSAQKGYAYAASMLGQMHQLGEINGRLDYENARHWFELAAAKGHAWSMRQLGVLYDDGKGVEKDPAQAFMWYERAAREGDAWSQNRVGWMLRQGIGVTRDDEEAVTWFRLAAKNGEPVGDANLGYHYLHGLGVPIDLPEALEHLITATRQLDDSWINGCVTSVFATSSDATRRVLYARLLACSQEPDLLQASGSLPEICLGLLGTAPKEIHNQNAIRRLLQRMASSGRRQSLVALGSHAFLGWHMPYDLKQARTWAMAAIAAKTPGGPLLLARIDSVAAPTAAERADAHTKLIELADAGDGGAALLLLQRAQNGLDESTDETVAHLEKFLLQLPKDSPVAPRFAQQLTAAKKALAARAVATPSPEMIAERVARIESARDPQGDCVPTAVWNEPPSYPFDLKTSDLDGTAQVEFIVRPNGLPADVHCVSSSHPLFALAAENCVKKWRFAPGRKAGRAVSTRMQQPFAFNLKD